MSNPTQKVIGDQLFQAFVDLGPQMGLQEVIWNRQIWSTGVPHVHHYTGKNPHTDHVHVGFTRAGSQNTSFPLLMIRIAQIRTGLEELAGAGLNGAGDPNGRVIGDAATI